MLRPLARVGLGAAMRDRPGTSGGLPANRSGGHVTRSASSTGLRCCMPACVLQAHHQPLLHTRSSCHPATLAAHDHARPRGCPGTHAGYQQGSDASGARAGVRTKSVEEVVLVRRATHALELRKQALQAGGAVARAGAREQVCESKHDADSMTPQILVQQRCRRGHGSL